MKHQAKRALSCLLSLALALSLLPGLSLTALAGDGNPYAGLVPTGSEETDALTAKQVTFNGKKWYVIKDESTAENAGTLTLLYAGNLANAPFDEGGSNNYASSSIKTALGNMTATGAYKKVADAINDTENGKLYLLSEEEANQVPLNVRKDFPSDAWWLRTSYDTGGTFVKYVYATAQDTPGKIANKGIPTYSFGVRPALQLDLSKVVFDTETKTFAIPATAPTDITVTGATLVAGYGAGRVSVDATAAAGHTLSYQWYSNTTNSNEGGTLIENATSATYDIPTGKTADDYYYCVVTATRTDNSQTASVASPVAVVTVADGTDALVAKLAEKKSIDLSQYYLIPAEDMYFTSKEYWNKNSSWEKLPDEAGKEHIATKQFTIQGLPKESLIFCKAYYSFEAVAWESSSSSSGQSGEIGKSYNLLTTINDLSNQFDWWDNYSFFGFNLTKYAEGDFNTKEEADLSIIRDAFRIYVPKPADAAEVNSTAYPTVADAIRAAGEGDTVKLLRDVTENVVLRAGTNIVLDLNGHTLTNDGRHCTIVAQNGSTLIVTDSSEEKTGTVDNTTHGCAPLFNNGGTVTLNGGTFIRSVEDGNANGGNTYYTVVNHGTMTINEGVTVSNDKFHYSSLIANGYNELTKTGYREIDPKVSNGYVEGENAANPTLTINGGTFTGGNQALKNDVNGVATIKGGSFSSTTGNAIKNLGELNISGGTFTAEAEGKFALLNATESGKTYGPESVTGITTVTGGTFNGKLKNDGGATIAFEGMYYGHYLADGIISYDDFAPAVRITEQEVPLADASAVVTPFEDVATDAYYADAVAWAYANDITAGVSEQSFGPGETCTRGQMVTFLWRAAGCPEPTGTASAFSDVAAGSYYEKAVAWAVENGITDGVGDGKFDPDAIIDRAQAVTFLYRANGSPAAATANRFTDVTSGAYYADAVDWAVANGITDGVGNNAFAPDTNCDRGQTVTFLYRAYNEAKA